MSKYCHFSTLVAYIVPDHSISHFYCFRLLHHFNAYSAYYTTHLSCPSYYHNLRASPHKSTSDFVYQLSISALLNENFPLPSLTSPLLPSPSTPNRFHRGSISPIFAQISFVYTSTQLFINPNLSSQTPSSAWEDLPMRQAAVA